MREITVRCLWHAFEVRADDAALLSMVHALAPPGGQDDEVAFRVSLSVAHDATDGYVLFDGPDRFAETAHRDEACRILVDRMSLRALEVAHLTGWLPFRGSVRSDSVDGVATLVIAGPDLLAARDWFLTDGWRVIDISRSDELPTLTKVSLLVHWVTMDVVISRQPLASIEAARVLVMQAGLVPEDLRRDMVRVATALASTVTSHSVAAASIGDAVEGAGERPHSERS